MTFLSASLLLLKRVHIKVFYSCCQQGTKMSRRGERNEETDKASVSSNVADDSQRMTTIYAVYLIAALDITWMFLQFSVTPVSI